MPQDMSQVPMNYRPAMQYTGRMRDLLYAPGYKGLQDALVKIEEDKLQRQLALQDTEAWQKLNFQKNWDADEGNRRASFEKLKANQEFLLGMTPQQRAAEAREMATKTAMAAELNKQRTADAWRKYLGNAQMDALGSGPNGNPDVLPYFAPSGAFMSLGYGSHDRHGKFGRF